MRKRRHDYTPDPALLAAMPAISGNTVNGVGETVERPPSPFFWHPPDRQTHGGLLRHIGPLLRPKVGDDPSFRNPANDRGPALVDRAATRVERPSADWTRAMKAFALANEADLVGVTPMRPIYVFEGYAVAEPVIIVIGVAHDYEQLAKAPATDEDPSAYRELHAQYNRGARAASRLANWIREQGWNAQPWLGPMADAVNLVPAALAAGLGELGKHGSIINRTYGSGFRLAGVTTDLPLDPDAPDRFGADAFCTHCQVCREACPPDAISDLKTLVRGVEKWYVDFDRCIPYFGEHYACGICIAVCPWTRPGVADRLVTKLARRESD